ncbi:MAG: O-antigen ligase family protein [Candidatus Hydrogenedentes bacterium]|nr:O-antigen ligase family protein [Candidatus Hydrogenedentota bacterium]
MPQSAGEVAAGPVSRAERYVLCAAIVAGAVAYSTQLTSFLHAKEAVFAAGAGVLGVFTLKRGRFPGGALWLVAPFGVSLAWGLLPDIFGHVPFGTSNLVECLRWMTVLLFALCAFPILCSEEGRQALLRAIVGSAVIVGVLALLQYGRLMPYFFPDYGGTAQRVYSVFGNAGLLGGYLAAALPLALSDAFRPGKIGRIALLSLAVVAGALLLSGARSAWIAAAAGAAFILIRERPSVGRLSAFGVAAIVFATLFCLVAPEETVERLISMFRAGDPGRSLREWFWLGTLRMIEDAPLAGVGLGNYSAFSARYLGEVLWEPGGERLAHNLLHTDHAHCDVLELLAELGVLGMIPLALWWGRLIRCRGPEWGGLLSLAVFSLAYFPFYSAPHALLGLLLAACLLGRSPRLAEDCPASLFSRFLSLTAGGGALLSLPLVLWMVVFPSYLFRTAQAIHVAGGNSLPAYERAVAVRWAPPDVYEKYGLALLEAGRHEDARKVFTIACSQLDSGAAYLGLGASQLRAGDTQAARVAIEACLKRWPSSFEAWALLMLASPVKAGPSVFSRARLWLKPDELRRLSILMDRAAPAATP